jgi:hypothetical protein
MTRLILTGLLTLVAVACAVRGTRHVLRGLRDGASLELARGLRGCVIALALGAFAAGILARENGILVLAAVFLAEELYETGLLIAIVRGGEAADGTSGSGRAPMPPANTGWCRRCRRTPGATRRARASTAGSCDAGIPRRAGSRGVTPKIYSAVIVP